MRLLVSNLNYLFIACSKNVLAIPLRDGEHTKRMLQAPTAVEQNASIITLAISKCGNLLLGGYDDKSIVSWDINSYDTANVHHFKLRKKPQTICSASYHLDVHGSTVKRDLILVSDKFGEVHALDLQLKAIVLLTGHSTSVITEMVCATVPISSSCTAGLQHESVLPVPPTTQAIIQNINDTGRSIPTHSHLTDDNLLITSDRDEKIRISHFPACHVIHR